MASAIVITLMIENSYELYAAVTTQVIDKLIPAPPDTGDDEAFEAWAYEHIYSNTGVGHDDGDSWYDGTVTACSDPTLIGRTFQWGY